MMKRTRSTAGILLGGLVATAALFPADEADAQQVFRYRLSGDWSTVTDGTGPGWGLNPNNDGSPGAGLPGAADQARINWGGNTVTVSSVVPEVNRVMIGVDESGTVEVQAGGDLYSNQDILAGNNNANATGTLIVRDGGLVTADRILWAANNSADGVIQVDAGGTVEVFSHLWWGVTGTATIDIAGTVTQFGGILGMGTNNAVDPTGGTATVTILDGGILSLNNMAASGSSIQPGSVLDIQGTGEVWITGVGDPSGAIRTNYVETGKITGNGVVGTDAVDVSFDGVKVVISANELAPPVPFQATITQQGGGFELSWPSQAGMLYNVRRSETLTGDPATWTLVASDIAATAPTNTEPVMPAEASLYYIVEEFPAP